MSKYMDPLLRVLIIFMFWISIMRIRYIWTIHKKSDGESDFIFRNQDGDWSILLFVLLIMNKSRFDRFQFAYQPLLRHLYIIVIGLFVVYSILQFTQFVVLTKGSLMTQEAIIKMDDIKQCNVKKQGYGYKFTVSYMKKNKNKSLSLFTNKKSKEIIEKRLEEKSINIV